MALLIRQTATSSGNSLVGIHIVGMLSAPSTGNIIQGNFVGVAAEGKGSVGNRTEPAPAPGAAEGNNLFGIEISGGNLNTVGGTAAGARNVVGLNGDGIEIDNGAQQNIVQGNYVGVARMASRRQQICCTKTLTKTAAAFLLAGLYLFCLEPAGRLALLHCQVRVRKRGKVGWVLCDWVTWFVIWSSTLQILC